MQIYTDLCVMYQHLEVRQRAKKDWVDVSAKKNSSASLEEEEEEEENKEREVANPRRNTLMK